MTKIRESEFMISQFPLTEISSEPTRERAKAAQLEERMLAIARAHSTAVPGKHSHMPNFEFSVGRLMKFINEVRAIR